MRSVKLVLLSLVIIFVALVIVQNLGVFMHKEPLGLNLLIWNNKTAPIPLSVYFLGFFLIGLLFSYFHGLAERFRARKTIREHIKTIRKLEEEIKVLKSMSTAQQTTNQKESEGA